MTQVDADMTDAQEHPGHPAVDAQQENAVTGKEAPATGTPSSLAVKSAMVRRLRKYRSHQSSYSAISPAAATSHQHQDVQGRRLKS